MDEKNKTQVLKSRYFLEQINHVFTLFLSVNAPEKAIMSQPLQQLLLPFQFVINFLTFFQPPSSYYLFFFFFTLPLDFTIPDSNEVTTVFSCDKQMLIKSQFYLALFCGRAGIMSFASVIPRPQEGVRHNKYILNE